MIAGISNDSAFFTIVQKQGLRALYAKYTIDATNNVWPPDQFQKSQAMPDAVHGCRTAWYL